MVGECHRHQPDIRFTHVLIQILQTLVISTRLSLSPHCKSETIYTDRRPIT